MLSRGLETEMSARALGHSAAELLMQHDGGMLRKFGLEFHLKKKH